MIEKVWCVEEWVLEPTMHVLEDLRSTTLLVSLSGVERRYGVVSHVEAGSVACDQGSYLEPK